jgi:hypothetical protein
VFWIGTEWTHIARALVKKAMTYHFVLSLEALSTFGTGTAWYRAKMRAILVMDIFV